MSGGGKGGSTTSSTQIDPQMKAMYLSNYDTAKNIANIPYQAYTGERVAGLNPTQQAGTQALAGIGTGSQGNATLQSAIQAAQGATQYQPQQVGEAQAPNLEFNYNPMQLGTNFQAPNVGTSYSAPTVAQNINAPTPTTSYTAQQIGTNISAPQLSTQPYNPMSIGGNYTPQDVQSNYTPQNVSTDYTPQSITAGQLSNKDLSSYTNPYQQQVTDATIQSLERQRQIAENRTKQQQSAAGAFGGTRHAVADALTNEAYGRTSAETLAALNAQGFTQAQNAATADINRQLSADQANQAAGLQGAQLKLSQEYANQQAGADAARMGLQAQMSNQQAGLQGAQLGQDAQRYNQAAGLEAAGLAQQAGMANQDASLRASGLGLQAGQANQAAALDAARMGQAGEFAGIDAYMQAQGLNQQGRMADQSAYLDASRLGQQGQLANQSAAIQGQGLNLQAGQSNQQAMADAARLGLTADQSNVDAMLRTQALNMQGQAQNQQAGLTANQQALSGAQLMGNMGSQEFDVAMARANALAQAGAPQHVIDQARMDAQYQEFMRRIQQPYMAQDIRNSALGMMPVGQSTTQSQQPGLMNYIQAIAGPAAMFAASDERLKYDIKTAMYSGGVRWATYKYKGDPAERTHLGVIAQEVKRTHPSAVHKMSDGMLVVDYSKLMVA